MLYLKILGAGVLLSLVIVVAWLGLKLVAFTLYWRWILRPRLQASGSGGIGSSSVLVTTWELVIIAAVGFMAGVWVMLRW